MCRAWKRRCPPGVLNHEPLGNLPSATQRVTVFGSTRNISATSPGVKTLVSSVIACPLLSPIGTGKRQDRCTPTLSRTSIHLGRTPHDTTCLAIDTHHIAQSVAEPVPALAPCCLPCVTTAVPGRASPSHLR